MKPKLPTPGKVAFCVVALLPLAGLPLSAAAGGTAYDKAMELLAAGEQPEAEHMVEQACSTNWVDPDLWFLRGVLERSRFNKQDAATCLSIAWSFDPESDRAQAAKAILFMDRGKDIDDNFQTLETLIEKDPDDMLLRWLFAIQCREQRYRQPPRRAEEGARQYEIILQHWDPGPVLVHQTYANILSEQLGRHEEALSHRKIAVEQSYKAWTCQGYGNTLRCLGRFDEAVGWLEKAVELAPDDPAYRRSLRRAKMEARTARKSPYAKAGVLRGGYAENLPLALELYKQAAEAGVPHAYQQMGIIYRNGGKGVPQNQAKAAECFEKGYEKGIWHCATLLGIMYEFGRAGPINQELALKWFHVGADKHNQIQSIRALLYYYTANPDPARRDAQKAREYLEKYREKYPDSATTQAFEAMVCALEGDFGQAIRIQEKLVARDEAQETGGDPGGYVSRNRKRLECYRKGIPWTDDQHWPSEQKQQSTSAEAP